MRVDLGIISDLSKAMSYAPIFAIVGIVAILAILVLFLLKSWQIDGGTTSAANKPRAMISVHADGSVLLDGSTADFATIDQRLSELAKEGGVVWYYREAATDDPPAIGIRIVEAVVMHRLPITLSSRPDFSDQVDSKGDSRPRKP